MESSTAPTGDVGGDAVGVAKSRYETLTGTRTPYLSRARDMSLLTIPTLLPPEGDKSHAIVPDPHQSIGSRGTRNISSKLVLTLIPPNRPFFQYELDTDIRNQLEEDPELKDEVEDKLIERERQVLFEFDKARLRSVLYQIFLHLVVAGNALLHVPNDGPAKMFPLTNYVVQRDPRGNPMEIVVKESTAVISLPKEVRDNIAGKPEAKDGQVDVFTHIKLTLGEDLSPNLKAPKNKRVWHVYQECGDQRLPGSEGWHHEDDPQWFALRMSRVDGEHYGRGYVEDYHGDLDTADTIAEALAEGSLASAFCRFGIKPGVPVTGQDIEETPNLGFVEGLEEGDVFAIRVEKRGDFAAGYEYLTQLRRELGFAFLLNTSVQRNGERVTAEEIRFMAQELEDALGGIYSLLVEELQRPLLVRMTKRIEKRGKLAKLPDSVEPVIIAGFEALGRGHELARFQQGAQLATEILGPDWHQRYGKPLETLRKIWKGVGINPKDVVADEQELAQRNAADQQAKLTETFGPEVVKQVGGVAQAAAKNGSAVQPTEEQ